MVASPLLSIITRLKLDEGVYLGRTFLLIKSRHKSVKEKHIIQFMKIVEMLFKT